MSRTYLLTLSIFAASKPRADATEHMPFKDYDGFAAVSGLSTPPEGTTAGSQLAAIGWNSCEELNRRVLVRIELPDEVLVGPYQIANVTRHGLHASEKIGRAARDGMGSSVYAYISKPSSTRETGSDEAAFNAAVHSGLFLSIPQETGTRRKIAVNVLAISPVYKAYEEPIPDGWREELDAQLSLEENGERSNPMA